MTYSEKQRRLCTLWAFTIGILIGHYLYATGRWTYTYYESRVWFESAAAQQMRDTLTSRGIAFRTEPHKIATLADREVWLADFEDTEGNTLALMSEPRLGQ